MWELIIPHIAEIGVFIIGLIFTFMAKKKWLSEKISADLERDVAGAVTAVYHEYVKARKESAEDGKLTDNEKKAARDLAIDKIKLIGKEKGIDYAKEYAAPAILGLIEKFVQKNKK